MARPAFAQSETDGGANSFEAADAGAPAPATAAPSQDGGLLPTLDVDAAAPAPVDAGDVGAPNESTALASVVVTAEKRSEDIKEVPLAITAVSEARVRELDVRASSDVPRLVPNMSAATTEGRSRPRWFIRGIGNNDTSSNAVSPIGV
ncbi:MAG: Plug domain-containing protein, partial [Polyangiaceae bacterium]|nr:Plug domain-containing protein [Polyangiaceae bacterium]